MAACEVGALALSTWREPFVTFMIRDIGDRGQQRRCPT
jgi:hypothetical protein